MLKDATIGLYTKAADYALVHGVIIADTKFEFGMDSDGSLILADEVLTPDSSRFWPKALYSVGKNPPSLDKQFVRDWLDSINFNHQPPSVPSFSAIGYFFAEELSKKLDTPVGLIDTPLGGTKMQCWLPEEKLTTQYLSETLARHNRAVSLLSDIAFDGW